MMLIDQEPGELGGIGCTHTHTPAPHPNQEQGPAIRLLRISVGNPASLAWNFLEENFAFLTLKGPTQRCFEI